MGYYESRVAATIVYFLERFLETHELGIVLGADAPLEILPKMVRIPDASFIRWDQFPDRRLPRESILTLAPDLAVEVLSQSNTEGEMERKLQDYFAANVRMVWYVDPQTQTARVYTAADQSVTVGPEQTLSGGDVLPGFELPLKDLFARAGRRADG